MEGPASRGRGRGRSALSTALLGARLAAPAGQRRACALGVRLADLKSVLRESHVSLQYVSHGFGDPRAPWTRKYLLKQPQVAECGAGPPCAGRSTFGGGNALPHRRRGGIETGTVNREEPLPLPLIPLEPLVHVYVSKDRKATADVMTGITGLYCLQGFCLFFPHIGQPSIR